MELTFALASLNWNFTWNLELFKTLFPRFNKYNINPLSFPVTWSMIAKRPVMFPRAALDASREDEADDHPWIKLQQNSPYT